MAARVQNLILGLGKAKQADIATISASFVRFKKLNMDLTSTGFTTENDAVEVGKGNEFISPAGVFPVAYTPGNRIEKYSSAEFAVWAFAYALGGVTEATGLYTLVPIDPGTTLELPYFSVVEQIPEGGGAAVDNAYIGCAIEEVTLEFSSGAGRATGKVTCSWIGSGKLTTPSSVTVPAVQSEFNMLSASMALAINGTNYVTNKNIVSGSFSWKNNLMEQMGFFPGSGLQNGAAIRGRLEIGARAVSCTFTARLVSGSPEYAALIAQTTGTFVLTMTYDATHTLTITCSSISYEVVNIVDVGGLVAVTVVVAVKQHASLGTVVITGKCAVSGIAQ